MKHCMATATAWKIADKNKDILDFKFYLEKMPEDEFLNMQLVSARRGNNPKRACLVIIVGNKQNKT